MNRRSFGIILGLLVVAGVAAWLLWPKTLSSSGSPLPAVPEIESLMAQRITYSTDMVPGATLPAEYKPTGIELPYFTVPARHLPDVLKNLEAIKEVENEEEPPMVFFGRLVFKTKAGQTVHVEVYFTKPDEPAAFNIISVGPAGHTAGKYRGGSLPKLWSALFDAYVTHKKTEPPKPETPSKEGENTKGKTSDKDATKGKDSGAAKDRTKEGPSNKDATKEKDSSTAADKPADKTKDKPQ